MLRALIVDDDPDLLTQMKSTLSDAFEIGAVHYFAKPCKPRLVREAILSYLKVHPLATKDRPLTLRQIVETDRRGQPNAAPRRP